MTTSIPGPREVPAAEVTGDQVIAAVAGMVAEHQRMRAVLRAVARAYHLQLTHQAEVTAVVVPLGVMAEIEELAT